MKEHGRVSLRLHEIPELPGEVVKGGDMVNLHFDFEPDHAPAELCERLRQLAAA